MEIKESKYYNEDRKTGHPNHTQNLRTDSNLQSNLNKNLPKFLPKLNNLQTLLINIPFVESYKEILSSYNKMRDIIENSLDYINMIKLCMTINKIHYDFIPAFKNETENSKSIRSDLILFKSKNSLKHKISETNKITL